MLAGGDWVILMMSEKRGHGNWNVICEKVFYTFVSLLFKHLIESCKILKSFIELDLIRINGLAKICNMGWSVLDPSLLSNQIFKGGIANKILNSNPDLCFFSFPRKTNSRLKISRKAGITLAHCRAIYLCYKGT